MGEEVAAQEFSRADRTRHREKVRRCLDVFARMLREARFDTDDPMTGLEVELNLVGDNEDPALRNAEALEAIADPGFVTELGQFNIEINVPPVKLREGGLSTFEQTLRESLNSAEEKSSQVGAHMVMIGILPTLAEGHLSLDSITPNPRYKLLSEQIMSARGEDISIAIAGNERLMTTADSIVPEAACTSTQFHVQTSPDQFAQYWNASQAISAIQIAVGANSPYLLGRELWRETRIPLFAATAPSTTSLPEDSASTSRPPRRAPSPVARKTVGSASRILSRLNRRSPRCQSSFNAMTSRPAYTSLTSAVGGSLSRCRLPSGSSW